MQEIGIFEYESLVETLNKWTIAYEKGDSQVQDTTYDIEYKKLLRFERLNPDKVSPESPTQKVRPGSAPDLQGKVAHSIFMGSIANSATPEEFNEWYEKRVVANNISELVLEYKIDGASLALIYENGILENAITRGDGTVGECVLANAMAVNDIPHSIPTQGRVEVRGECVWMLENFDAYNNSLIELGKKPMANPRNGVAGTMSLNDSKEVTKRKIHFIAYKIIDGGTDTQLEDLKLLSGWGFTVSEHYLVKTKEKALSGIDYMGNKRFSLSFMVDGLVVKVNDKNLHQSLGGDAKTQHAFTAYKFPPEIKSSKLISVGYDVGKSGAVAPVLNIEPCAIGGTTVRRITAHNWNMLEYLGVYEGCSVSLRRAGEVIPQFIEVVGNGRSYDDYHVLNSARGGKAKLLEATKEFRKNNSYPFINRPEECPVCKTKLVNDMNDAGETLTALICPNNHCEGRQKEILVSFVSRESMNIMGVGDKAIYQLYDAGLIKYADSLYRLTKEDVLKLSGFAETSAVDMIDVITRSKSAYLNQLLKGFGIPDVGEGTAARLAAHFKTLQAVASATVEELSSVPDVGEATARSVVSYFTDMKDVVQYFIDNSIATEAKPSEKKSDLLKGFSMIMTGSSEILDRDDFKKWVPENGGKVVSSISKKTSHVVLCAEAGPKKVQLIKELQGQGVPIKVITDQEFLDMIG